MRLKNKKGSVLITLIVAMVLMAFLGLGIYSLFTSSAFSELLSNRNDNAYQLAKAGIRFAADTNGTIVGDFLMPDNSKKFNLAKNGNQITSTGIVNAGTFLEARRVLQYTISGILDPRIPDLPQKNKTIGTPGSIANDGTTITLGGSTSPGASQSYGAIWYNGNNANGNCSAGACSFNIGIRAYFEFQFPNNQNSGDGFTFAIMSALTNTNDRTGGFSKTEFPGSYTRSDGTTTSVAGGELMGYAGPGNTYNKDSSNDGQGLRPPKMAVEFDTYTNNWPSAPNTPIYLAMTRNDPNLGTYGDHLALMFWGDTTLTGNTAALPYSGGGTRTFPLSSFDDNRHGAGQTGRVNGLGVIGYDMEDGVTRSCRIEITRPTSADTSGICATGTYKYTINVWVEQTSALSALTKSHLQDVLVPYTDTSTKISSQYACFTSTEHNNFANIFWGFTQGTGDAVQQVPITNTVVFFPNTASTCSYATSPASATYPSAGGSGSVALTTAGSCYWAVQSLASWITITSTPLYGQGNGTISYTVAANTTGAPRTGYINIAGQTFTVIETVPYTITATAGTGGSITPSSRTVNYGNTTTFTVTPNTGYTTASVGGTCGGSLSGTTYTTNAIYSNCTVTATFTPITYTVTPSAGTGGSISPSTPVGVNYGNTTTFTVTPSTGYTTASVGGTCGGSLSGTTYTTNAITANCTVSATFTINTYTVTATAGRHGSITPSSRTVNYGNTTTFTVTPNSGYTASVSGCGGSLSGTTYTTGAITANCAVTATFN